MIDVSDGLGAEAEHLAAASGVGIEIEVDRVPRGEGVSEVAEVAGRDPSELVVSGGEDYELLCAIPRAALADCRPLWSAAGPRCTRSGGSLPVARSGSGSPGGAQFRQAATTSFAGRDVRGSRSRRSARGSRSRRIAS